METMRSPYKSATDSSSRQLLYELNRLVITTQEDFYARLDIESEEREAVHHHALEKAAAEHYRVRQGAENEREKLELQLRLERERREDDERRELERQRQERTKQEIIERKKHIERIKAAEAAEKRRIEADAARNADIAAAERKNEEKKKRDVEILRQRKDAQEAEAKKNIAKEAISKENETALVVEKQQQPQVPVNQPGIQGAKSNSGSQVKGNYSFEVEHNRYIEIHRNLKDLRKFMMTEARKEGVLKQQMGNMRREIKKSVGQITEGKGANMAPVTPTIAFPSVMS